MTEKWNAHGHVAGQAIKRAAEVTANGVNKVTAAVARNDGRVADGTQAVAQAVGNGLNKVGRGVAAVTHQASKSLHGGASRLADAAQAAIVGDGPSNGWRKAAGLLTWGLTKTATHAAGLVANAGTVAGIAAATAGRLTDRSAPAIGGAFGGVVRGAAEVTSNAIDGAALPASHIDAMRMQLRALGQVELERSKKLLSDIERAQDQRRKPELLDLLVVGGITLADAMRDPAGVPPEVEQAFQLAYPGLSQTESFSEAVNRMSSDELVGLVSGVKGKLFETELVGHLNSGGLPDGFQATIAESVTQPGWDIQITDSNGQVSEFLQAKATESVQYVKEALERYPDIDVTTTSEVHAQLLARGLAENVNNSGISESVLQAKVEAASQAGSVFDASDLVPSSIGLAVIALSVFMDKGASLREKGAAFGSRSAKAGASSVAGKVVLVATQTWWLGLIAGVGSGWLASRGHNKREQYEALSQALKTMKARSVAALGQTPTALSISYRP